MSCSIQISLQYNFAEFCEIRVRDTRKKRILEIYANIPPNKEYNQNINVASIQNR